MKLKAKKNYKTPSYPVRLVYEKHPELILEHIPYGWLKNRVITGALSVFVLSGFTLSCSSDGNSDVAITDGEFDHPDKINLKKNYSIAPLFIHGDGRGSTGCIVMNPPCFLTEADAKEIIFSKLEGYGLKFDSRNYVHRKNFTKHILKHNITGNHSFLIETTNDLVFDGLIEDINLAIKFISHDNVRKLRDIEESEDKVWISVGYTNILGEAQEFREKMKNEVHINMALFYDPMTKMDGNYDMEKARTLSRKLLAEQVDDFLHWLRREFPAYADKKGI